MALRFIEFVPTQPVYQQAPPKKQQIQAIQIIGYDAEGAMTSPLKNYSFTKGIPNELKKYCVVKEQLVCKNVGTGDRKVGDRMFDLTVIPKGLPPEKPIMPAV